jgi:NAD(P)H-nitrite reductase large subunit
MSVPTYPYIIVGGGLAAGSAVSGIREVDKDGPVLVIGRERHLPYDRPPLSKQLWFGKKTVEQIFVHDQGFYDQNGVKLALGREVVAVDAEQKLVTDGEGNTYGYRKLLLATGGVPRALSVAGGDLGGLCYYRFLDDYLKVRAEASEGKSAVVIGGGFIGSEMAAALNISKLHVTMIFPSEYLCQRVFPRALGRAIQHEYIARGVEVLSGEETASLGQRGSRLLTHTASGKEIESDLVIVGVGIGPAVMLAEKAGLRVGDGIVVNGYLQTSHPDVYAAGDNALFPYQVLGKDMRVEHWDNALNQGKWAGRNMAGAGEPYDYMPYFYSDLFAFGYEAVGEVDARLETFSDWQKENDTGVIYYLRDGRVRGAMMCNVWDRVEAARELIRGRERFAPDDLRGAIR